jgi:hypothetical protein
VGVRDRHRPLRGGRQSARQDVPSRSRRGLSGGVCRSGGLAAAAEPIAVAAPEALASR